MENRLSLPLRHFILFASILAAACSSEGIKETRDSSALGGTRDSSPAPTCIHDGHTYQLGDSFRWDCNTCTCTERGSMCTAMACPVATGGVLTTGGIPATGGITATGGIAITGGALSGTGGSLPRTEGLLSTGGVMVRTGGTPATGGTVTRTGGSAIPTDAGTTTCTANGRTYAIGESFKIDCNTCSCSAWGIACTAMACLTDAAVDTVARSDGGTCSLPGTLTFGRTGGNAIYQDEFRLTSTTFTATRSYSLRAARDGATSASCSPPLPACDSTSAISVATISADLALADVQAVLGSPSTTVPLYGSDPRPMDGTVFSIALEKGGSVLVGTQCASPAMSSCRTIPDGLVKLTQDLQKMSSQMMASSACANL